MTNNIKIERTILLVTSASSAIAILSLFAMMLLITLDVTLNKAIGRPIPGTVEVTAYYFMVLVVFMTFPSIEKNQAHISADFIVSRFSPRVQRVFDVTGKLLTILFYSFLAYAAFQQAVKSTKRLETVMSNFTFYIWPARWGVVLGIASAIIIIVMILIRRFLWMRTKG